MAICFRALLHRRSPPAGLPHQGDAAPSARLEPRHAPAALGGGRAGHAASEPADSRPSMGGCSPLLDRDRLRYRPAPVRSASPAREQHRQRVRDLHGAEDGEVHGAGDLPARTGACRQTLQEVTRRHIVSVGTAPPASVAEMARFSSGAKDYWLEQVATQKRRHLRRNQAEGRGTEVSRPFQCGPRKPALSGPNFDDGCTRQSAAASVSGRADRNAQPHNMNKSNPRNSDITLTYVVLIRAVNK